MGKCDVTYRECRFVFDDETTEAFVLLEASGDCPHTVQGWHAKTFGSSMSAVQILDRMAEGKDDPMLWPRKAPPA